MADSGAIVADSGAIAAEDAPEATIDDEEAGTEMQTVSKVKLDQSSFPDPTAELVLAFANRDELLEEAVKLREQVKSLQALAPKVNLVRQNINLVAKNKKLVESIELKNIEVLNLKPMKEKYLQLSKKLGNEKHLELRANTKLEITNYIGNSLNKTYDDINKMHYSEVEMVMLAQLLFLDISGGNQYQLLSKLLSVSSQGIRKCVQSKLKSLIDEADKQLKVIVVTEEPDAKAINESTPGNVSGVERILPKRYQVVTAPPKYDPRFDSFDQSRYLTGLNINCKFVRHTHVTYIATNPSRRCKHKFDGQKTCMLPGCKAVFTLDVTPIGPVIIVSPEYHPYFDTEVWVCDAHVLKSMEEGLEDETIFEQAAIDAEASSSVVRQLFPNVNGVYFSDSDEEDPKKMLTNTLEDAANETASNAKEAAPTQTMPKEGMITETTESEGDILDASTGELLTTEPTVSDLDILDASTEDGEDDVNGDTVPQDEAKM